MMTPDVDWDEKYPNMTKLEVKQNLELEFLRFFYSEAGDYMGPADCEIYEGIKRRYDDGGGVLPEGYELDTYDDEEDEELEE